MSKDKKEMEEKVFDQLFFTLLPAPPFGKDHPCYAVWQEVNRLAKIRAEVCLKEGASEAQCVEARNHYFRAAREYSRCMNQWWESFFVP